MEIENCSSCGAIYVKNPMRDTCDACYKQEEAKYDIVYKFLRKRENRAATIDRVTEVTKVEASLLHKWIRKGRLQVAQFPNLGYPCDQCGKLINEGRLCERCSTTIKQELNIYEKENERQKELRRSIYHSQNKQ